MNVTGFNKFLKQYKEEINIDDFYDERKIYPLKKTNKQILGSENIGAIFLNYFTDSGSVLDIGGNAGNLLLYDDKIGIIEKYSCLDVSKLAIDYGKFLHPNSNFYYYNKFNWIYNITGEPNVKYPEIEEHDYTFLYNVALCCDYRDLIEILQFAFKKTRKKIVFNVWNKNNINLLNIIYRKFYDIDITRWPKLDNNIFYLLCTSRWDKDRGDDIKMFDKDSFISNKILKLSSCSGFYAFYNIDYLKQRLINIFNCEVEISTPDETSTVYTLYK